MDLRRVAGARVWDRDAHCQRYCDSAYVRAGATFLSSNNLAVSAQFADAPISAPPFVTHAFLDNVFGDLSAGVDIVGANGLSVRASYGERFSNSFHERTGSVKAGWKF